MGTKSWQFAVVVLVTIGKETTYNMCETTTSYITGNFVIPKAQCNCQFIVNGWSRDNHVDRQTQGWRYGGEVTCM